MPNDREESTKNLARGIEEGFVGGQLKFNFYDDMPDDPNQVLGTRTSFKTKQDAIQKMDAADPVLSGLMESRIAAILGQPQSIDAAPEDKGERDYIDEAFSNITDWRDKQKNILEDSLKIGNAFIELVYAWGRSNGKTTWTLDSSFGGLIVRSPSRFAFKMNEAGMWDLLLTDYDIFMMDYLNQGEKADERKFKYMSYNSQHNNPVGRGVYNDIYNYWKIKKDQVKLYAILGEVFVATRWIVTPDNAENPFTPGEMASIKQFADNPLAYMSLVLPKTPIKFNQLSTNVTDPGKAFDAFINFCSLAMAYRIHGQGLALNESSGSQAKEEVRIRLFNHLTDSYAVQFENFINKIIKQLCDLNFMNPAYPKFKIIRPKADNPKEWVEAMKSAVELGANIPREWFEGELGVPNYDVNKEDALKIINSAGSGATFTEFLGDIERRINDYKFLTAA